MRRLYLDLKFTSAVPKAYSFSSEELSQASGANLGNFAFRHALRFLLNDIGTYTPVRWAEFSQIASTEKVDSVVVSCANWLGLSERDEASNLHRAQAIEKVDCNVVSFGLGVQAKISETLPKLGPNTLRLAKALSDRSKFLSVRDKLTQDTLAAEGIANTVVTGCPSNYINGARNLGAGIAAKARRLAEGKPSWKSLRTGISEASGGHKTSGKVLSSHLKMMADTPAFYLVQSPALLGFLLENRTDIPQFYRISDPFQNEPGRLNEVLLSKTLYFADMDAWMDFSRTCDISFGMRIHGTMIPLQSGVPSSLIAHDSRTVGLAEVMGIPWVSPEDFVEKYSESPLDFLGFIAGKMDAYDAHRKENARTMLAYIRDNGLLPHRSIQLLAE